MCKVVYLTTRCFDTPAKEFKNLLSAELRKRGISVVSDSTCAIKRLFRSHRTYGIAIAIDFFRDGKAGRGLTLNRQCSYIGREFAYNLSNAMDVIVPRIRWRDFVFVDSSTAEWRQFFHKISSNVKVIFYLCTCDNDVDYDLYSSNKEKIIKAFVDEIVRCLRSNYDYKDYQKRVRLAKLKIQSK